MKSFLIQAFVGILFTVQLSKFFNAKFTLYQLSLSQILGNAFWHKGDIYQCSDIGVANASSESRSSEHEQHYWICSLNGTSVEDMPCVDIGSASLIDERELEAMRQNNDGKPEGHDGDGMEHNLMCNEIKGEDRAAAALDRIRRSRRCYYSYSFLFWGLWYRRYRCY